MYMYAIQADKKETVCKLEWMSVSVSKQTQRHFVQGCRGIMATPLLALHVFLWGCLSSAGNVDHAKTKLQIIYGCSILSSLLFFPMSLYLVPSFPGKAIPNQHDKSYSVAARVFGMQMMYLWRSNAAAESTPVGFEPTQGDPIGLAGRRLSHSAKVSLKTLRVCSCNKYI